MANVVHKKEEFGKVDMEDWYAEIGKCVVTNMNSCPFHPDILTRLQEIRHQFEHLKDLQTQLDELKAGFAKLRKYFLKDKGAIGFAEEIERDNLRKA